MLLPMSTLHGTPDRERKMKSKERRDWFTKGGKRHQKVSQKATHGGYDCDTCGAPSAAISHSGEGSPIVVACPKCYLAALNAARATRPSRDELAARVNASIGA